jgi:hypothetical protein
VLTTVSIPIITNKVKSCLIQGRFDEALEYIVQAEISKTINPNEVKNLQLFKIEGYLGILKFNEALDLTKKLSQEKITLRNYSLTIQAMLFEIEALRNLQMFEEAFLIQGKLKNTFQKLSNLINTENSDLYAKYNFIIGHLQQTIGNIQESINYYLLTIKIVEKINDRLFLQKIYVSLSSAYWELNQLESAQKYCMQALAIKTVEESYLTISKCLNLLGLIAQDENNISTALNYYNQSLTLKYKLGNRIEIAKTLHSIGYVYQLLEKYSESIESLNECYNIFAELENYSEMAKLKNDIGNLFLKLSDIQEAMKNFKTGLSFSLRIKNDFLISKNYFSLSKLFLLKNDIKNATLYAGKCLELRTQLKNEKELGESNLQLALIHLIEKKDQLFLENLDKAKFFFKKSKNRFSYIKIEFIKIIYYDQIQNYLEIENITKQLNDVTDSFLGNKEKLLSDLIKATIWKNSTRLKEKAKAQKIFIQVTKSDLDVFLKEYSFIQILKLLFFEYFLNSNDLILSDIKETIEKLLILSTNNNQFILRLFIYKIKAKFSLLDEGIDEAISIMEEAFLFMQNKNPEELSELQVEYESLDKKISYWNTFKKKKKFTIKDFDQIGITPLIDKILDRNLIFYF